MNCSLHTHNRQVALQPIHGAALWHPSAGPAQLDAKHWTGWIETSAAVSRWQPVSAEMWSATGTLETMR